MDLNELVKEIEPEIINIWQRIHQNPELSMKEYKTADLIENKLKEIEGIDSIKRVGETGILVELKGTKEGKKGVIALRGDMDALPIQENTGLSFSSQSPGVMHACGHDVHTSILYGAVKVLSKYKNHFAGSIIFIFQPAEETLEGSKMFIDKFELDFSKIDGIAAVHVSPEIYAGTIGIKNGPLLASADRIDIKVIGKQGHAAHPHTVVDPIVISSHIIVALQTLISREIAAYDSAVISFGKINGGSAHNIIPNTVTVEGTLRTISLETRKQLHDSIVRICKDISSSMRGSCEVEITEGPPPLICDSEWVDRARKVGERLLGTDQVINLQVPSMGAEDFAYMKELTPGIFIRLGARKPGGPYGSIHSPTYYTDEKALSTGILTMAGLALDFFDVDY